MRAKKRQREREREMARVKGRRRQDRQHKCTAVIGHTGKSPQISVPAETQTLFPPFKQNGVIAPEDF